MPKIPDSILQAKKITGNVSSVFNGQPLNTLQNIAQEKTKFLETYDNLNKNLNSITKVGVIMPFYKVIYNLN